MVEFVKLLNRCCHLFSTYVASHKIEKEEQEKKRWSLRAQNTLSLYNPIYWCFCFVECSRSGVLTPLGFPLLMVIAQTSWCEGVFVLWVLREGTCRFRLAVPLRGTTHLSRQHSFCVTTLNFWASTINRTTPPSLPSDLTYPLWLSALNF